MALSEVSSIAELFSELPDQCQVCGSADATVYEEIYVHGIRITYMICANCGLVYQSPRIPETQIPHFYQSMYRLLNVGQTNPRKKDLEVQRKRANHIVDFLIQENNYVPSSHLDIGCGSGSLLHETQRRFRCRVSGIELDDAHRSYAVQNGLTIYDSLEQWKQHETLHVDLVTMSHVLEHLVDPIKYLGEIREILSASEGRVLLEVPNLYVHPAFELAHTYAFSLVSLSNTLHKAGFELLNCKLHSFPHSRVMPLYILVLARPCIEAIELPIKRDSFSRQRRKLGRILLYGEKQLRRFGRFFSREANK